MNCKYHSGKEASHICNRCNAPICDECAEEIKPGSYVCFNCAMVDTFTDVGTYLDAKREKALEKKLEKKKKWGPFHFFVIVSSVLLAVMWGMVLFGGQEAPSGTSNLLEKGKVGRVFLFLVDGGLKRYAHYNKNKFPENLIDVVPEYVKIKDEQVRHLGQLAYEKDPDPNVGYRLSFAIPPKGQMNIVLTAQGLEYTQSSEGGS